MGWRRRTAIGAAVTVVAAGVAWSQIGSDDGSGGDEVVVAPGAGPLLGGEVQPLADVGDVLPGRRPHLFVDGSWVLAASGTNYEAGGQTTTLLAASDDGGLSFRSIDIDASLAGPHAVLQGDSAVLVGDHCAPPVESNDAVCATADVRPLAFRVDLASGEVSEITPYPDDVSINGAVGRVDASSIFHGVTRGSGDNVLVRLDDDGTWSTTPAPRNASTVCAIEDTVVAVASAAPLELPAPTDESRPPNAPPQTAVPSQPGIPEVFEGEALWHASVSADGGRSWSDAVAYRSRAERDMSFVIGTTCGPSQVMVNSAQLAAFDPDTQVWTTIELPADLPGGIAPGTAAAWAGPHEFVIWTQGEGIGAPPTASHAPGEVGEAPAIGTRAVRVSGIGTTDQPSVSVGEPVDVSSGQPSAALSPSAAANGFVLIAGDTTTIGRLG